MPLAKKKRAEFNKITRFELAESLIRAQPRETLGELFPAARTIRRRGFFCVQL